MKILNDAGIDTADNNDGEGDDDDSGIWAQLEAAEPSPRRNQANPPFSITNPQAIQDSMTERNYKQEDSQAQPSSLFTLVDPEFPLTITQRRKRLRPGEPRKKRKWKLRQPRKKQTRRPREKQKTKPDDSIASAISTFFNDLPSMDDNSVPAPAPAILITQ